MKKRTWLFCLLGTSAWLSAYPAAANSSSYENLSAPSQALPWWSERNTLPTTQQPYLPDVYPKPVNGFTTPLHYKSQPAAAVNLMQTHYNPPAQQNCRELPASFLPDSCIVRGNNNRQGLQALINYLKTRNLSQWVAGSGANVSNAALLQTAKELLSWEYGVTPHSFRERFELREINQSNRSDNGTFTGYFTPVLDVRHSPDPEYRFPIYKAPSGGTRLNRAQIEQGALRGKRLEIAWTNDPVNLYFAHIQGSALARFADGQELYLDYMASNELPYRSIAPYLRNQARFNGSLDNQSIRRWLHTHPQRIAEVLNQNPRYIFFKLSGQQPRTTTGSGVISGHTVAVDDRYIPLGAVLLAEIPRIDHQGQRVGADWRLLFAQDRGDAIKGPGRLDLYTGTGQGAEQQTYRITGQHRTYLLVRRPGFLGDSLARR